MENQIGRRIFIKRTAGTALAFGAASIILTNRSLAGSPWISGVISAATSALGIHISYGPGGWSFDFEASTPGASITLSGGYK